VLAGRLMLHTSYRASAMLGGAMLALGSTVLVLMTPQSSTAWAVLGALIVGIGMGSCNTTYLVSVQGAAHRQSFEVECVVAELSARGTGSSRQRAEQDAARAMLEQLGA